MPVFTLPRELTPKFEIELGKIVTIGEGGYFFGYPHGWHSEVDRQYVAFVKRASVSAVPKTKPALDALDKYIAEKR